MLEKLNVRMDTQAKTITTREIMYGNSQATTSNYMDIWIHTYKGGLDNSRVHHTIYAKNVNSNILK